MKCPGCGLHHPPQYTKCVSCGRSLSEPDPGNPEAQGETEPPAPVPNEEPIPQPKKSATQSAVIEEPAKPARRSKVNPPKPRGGVPVLVGVFAFVLVVLISAGATIFLLTKSPDDERLYRQGLEQVSKGQYAFAVKTLTDAAALRQKDPRVYLALARAYVGIDQVDKAWDCISQAQQLGAGVASEPSLASDLANYYRQRGEYEKALNLLRPLAKAEVPGKKSELSDIDALWGDQSMRDGKLEQALRCWEEVRDLRDGSRASEAETRLATIYQRLATNFATDADPKNDGEALKYLNKLNNISNDNPKNLVMAAELYERQGQLELAIDQMRKAVRLSTKDPVLDRKLAHLLTRRGKELLDEGNSDAGYGYLQQARTYNAESALPVVTLRNLNITFDRLSRLPRITGQVWNPTENALSQLRLKVELAEAATSKVLWTTEKHVIDEFTPPLGSHESKNFDIESGVQAKGNGTEEFRVYLDGQLYKAYQIGNEKSDSGEETAQSKPEPQAESKPPSTFIHQNTEPPAAPPVVRESATPPPSAPQTAAPTPGPSTSQPAYTPRPGTSSEEKTMKDLDL